MDDCVIVVGDVDVVLEIGEKLMRAMTLACKHSTGRRTSRCMLAASTAQAKQHATKLDVSSLAGADGASAENDMLVSSGMNELKRYHEAYIRPKP